MWLFNIGRLLWICFVRVLKDYIFGFGVFRRLCLLFVWLFYCLVVFYFIEDVILLGIFSYVYNFDGDLKFFFFKSKCCFKVCLVLRDKVMMLIDFFDDVKCIIMWNLKNGLEIICIVRDEEVLFFVWF